MTHASVAMLSNACCTDVVFILSIHTEATMIYRRVLPFLSLVLLGSATAFAHEYRVGPIEVDNPWTRATPATAAAGGGFLAITNKGTTRDRLIIMRSPTADRVQLHQMTMEGNIMRMRELDEGLEIPPGTTLTLAPGRYHLLFMGLNAPVAQGMRMPLGLVVEHADRIHV